MKTTVTELPDSRAEVEVEIDADDVDRKLNSAARGLARDMRMPGFRKGKAPPSLVIQRVGRGAVLEQAVRDSLPEWYERALFDSGINPVGDPEIEVTSLPEEESEPLAFKFAVGVRPKAKLGEYKGLEVGRPPLDVPEETVDAEVERMRESMARLETVDRPAAEGDMVVIDFAGTIDGELFEGGEAHDHLLELGSGSLIEGFEEQITGAGAGDERTVKVTFPEDYRAEHLAGKDAEFAVTVKEVREKQLPDLDDDFASEATEFDTLEELREDIRSRLRAALEQQGEEEFRVAAVDAVAEKAEIEVPEEITRSHAEDRWQQVERQLASRGMDPAMYLQMQGKTREELIAESMPDAEKSIRRDAVLEAIADAEGIEPTEEEMVEALAHSAEHERTTPEKLLERLRKNGRDGLVRADLRTRAAIDLIVESAKPVEVEPEPEPAPEAEAGTKTEAPAEEEDGELWTPEKEREKAGGLWTPDSSEES
jgi:trigger factor